jgi:hypothetical protein
MPQARRRPQVLPQAQAAAEQRFTVGLDCPQ